ncbi:hypothetical protein [Streptomyces syringium]|uniref:hypothetical protein n=1 Tax=Streptomyces syringium TaxID=76729 RepID=UPI0034541997
MHMNSAPHLLAEDRPEFERVLDQALRTADHDPELAAAIGQRLDAEQLRTMARSAMAAISACAASEYQSFLKAREELRAPSNAAQPQPVGTVPRGADGGGGGVAPLTVVGEVSEAAGAGAGAVLAVLAPVLAGIAALLFLLVGYVLRTVASNEAVADPMVTVGWWFAGLTVAGVFVAMAAMLVTALRNGSGLAQDARGLRLSEDAERARDAWRQALLERGMLPFLRESLANAPLAPPTPPAPSPTPPTPPPRARDPHSRTPNLGYSRPGFSSPDDESSPSPRPGYSRPDFTSPDYGGPDHRPD